MISTSVFKFDAAFLPGPGLDDFDQLQNIARAGIAFIDDKISMHRRHGGSALSRAFQSQFLNQAASRQGWRWVLENASSARLFWLRSPAAFD